MGWDNSSGDQVSPAVGSPVQVVGHDNAGAAWPMGWLRASDTYKSCYAAKQRSNFGRRVVLAREGAHFCSTMQEPLGFNQSPDCARSQNVNRSQQRRQNRYGRESENKLKAGSDGFKNNRIVTVHKRIKAADLSKLRRLITSLPGSVTFNCLNSAPECFPRRIRCNIWIPTIWVCRPQRIYRSNTLYGLTTLASLASRNVTHPPLFPNCRNGI